MFCERMHIYSEIKLLNSFGFFLLLKHPVDFVDPYTVAVSKLISDLMASVETFKYRVFIFTDYIDTVGVLYNKGKNLRHDHVVHLQYQKKIICDQIRNSTPVLQGRFQCHKKQLARINVIDLK